MDQRLNNNIEVKNEHQDPKSFLQLLYHQTELCQYSKNPNFVGVTTLINSPIILECLITNHKNCSSLELSDPSSRETKIKLKINHGGCITIHAKQNKAIIITTEKRDLGRLSYR